MRPTRAEIVACDKRYVWHPYTAMDRYIETTDPLVIERAQGSFLFDADGRSYIDANSSWWVSTLGHNHPRLIRALSEQAAKLCHTSLAGVTHENAAMLAKELIEIAPNGLSRVFYSDDGSTAVEAAIKMAAQYWKNEGFPKKERFVSLDGAFHGETVGAASLGGIEVFRKPYSGVLFDCLRVPFPESADPYAEVFEALGKLIEARADEIAAVVLEPLVQGAAGMRMYPESYLRRASETCAKHNVLLIVDEVFTGYGRTGPMWACDRAGISPDILCIAKGFSGGMFPMAATLATERVFQAFGGPPERAFYYGHSYCGNPLGAAIAREVLNVFRDEQVLHSAANSAQLIAKAFAQMGQLQGVISSRSLGMIGALDLAADRSYLGGRGWRVFEEARKQGVYLRPLGDVVYIAPPLTIPPDVLSQLLNVVEASVRIAVG